MSELELTAEQLNDARDLIRHAFERRNHWQVLYGVAPLRERYLRAEVDMHVHVVRASLPDFCAVFQISLGDVYPQELDMRAPQTPPLDSEAHPRRVGGQGLNVPMLVGVVYFLEQPQGAVATPIPSVIRLQPLDHCSVVTSQAANTANVPIMSSPLALPLSTRPIPGDRESIGVSAGGMVQESELTRQLVKRGSKVVSDFADGDRPSQRNLRVVPSDAQAFVSSLRIEFRRGDFVWMLLEEDSLRCLKSLDLLLCAYKLGTDSIEWVHSLNFTPPALKSAKGSDAP